MVKAKEVKLIMNPGERAIGFEKRRIPRYRLVQQIDCRQRVRVPAKARPNDIIGARIELESDEISGWLLLDSQSLRGCDFGVQSFGDLLRDLTLDGKQLVQIAIVLLSPHVCVRACVDQLSVETKMRAGSADAAFQNMRYPQIISDLTEISFATLIHNTRPTDDFQVGDFGQLGQHVVLHTIHERAVFFLLAQIFKRQNGDSICYRTTDKFTFPNDPASGRYQSDQGRCQQRTRWIASHPFFATRDDASVAGADLVPLCLRVSAP